MDSTLTGAEVAAKSGLVTKARARPAITDLKLIFIKKQKVEFGAYSLHGLFGYRPVVRTTRQKYSDHQAVYMSNFTH